MAVEQFSVAVQGDFVAAQTRAKPIAALAELIWNGLDADATSIDVELVHDNLVGGALEHCRVRQWRRVHA